MPRPRSVSRSTERTGARRRAGACLAVALAALMLMPTPLWAQAGGSMETGSLINNRPAGGLTIGRKDARLISREFAACSVRRGRANAERYLATPIGGVGYAQLQRRVLTDDCLGAGTLTLPVEVIRGALFEQLYLLDYKSGPIPDLTAVAAIDYSAGYSAPVSSQAGNVIALAQFGDCVARADTHNAQRLLINFPDSNGESTAVRALMPRLSACVPAGQKITFSRSVLRAALAEGLYRLVRAAKRIPWGAG